MVDRQTHTLTELVHIDGRDNVMPLNQISYGSEVLSELNVGFLMSVKIFFIHAPCSGG